MGVDLERLLTKRMGGADRLRVTPEVFREQVGPGKTAPLARDIQPPWVYKYPMSMAFNRNVFSSVLAAVVNATVIPVTFTLPPTFVGWTQIFGIYVQSPTALTDITFMLRINEGPVEGWDNIKPPPGVANFFVQNFSDLNERVPNSGRIDVVVRNDAATGPWTVGAKIAGWYTPENEEERIYGSL